jgi:LysR family hydrogen peroxide-inducible transcriptional activator
MDLRQLAALVAIADHGTFSAAARALFTVQSNVSTHVARLEKELGVTLIDRQRGGLTDDGAVVVERARRILRELDDIAADVATHDDEVAGDTRLGVIGTTARWLMPQLLSQLATSHPKVHAIVHDGTTDSLIPRVVVGDLDAAVVHLPVDDPEVQVEALFAEDLVLLVNNEHPLAGRESISISELAEHSLLLPPAGTALRRVLDRAARAHGATLTAQTEIDGVRLLTSLAYDGFGAAIVPATAMPRWVTGPFSRIAVPELPRRVVGWAQRRRPQPNPATRAVRAATRELVAARGDRQPGVHVDASVLPGPRPS